MNEVFFSVIIPVHNSEKYLEKSVESIIHQTCGDWELLLIDDESTDRSSEMCKAYEACDSRIHYYYKKYGGAADTRNVGVELARGEYIYFVDSDDYCEWDLLETTAEILNQNHADMLVFGYTRHKNGMQTRHVYGSGHITREEAIQSLLVDDRIGNYVWNKVIARKLFEGLRFPKGEIFEDASIMYQLILKCDNIATVDKLMYHYQMRKNSASYVPSAEQLMFYWSVLTERKRILEQVYPMRETEMQISLTKGAVYIWSQLSMRNKAKQLKQYSFLVDTVRENRKLIRKMPLYSQIKCYLICGMPYQYAAIVRWLRGKNDG